MPRTSPLTPSEHGYLEELREEWLAHGRSCEPADREQTVEGIRRVYTTIDKPAPSIVVWMSSPLGGAFGSAALAVLPKALRGLKETRPLWGQLRGQLWDQLRDQLGDQLRGQLWDQLRDQLGDQLWDQLWDQLRDQLGDQLGGQLGHCWWGQHDAPWTAWWLMGRHCGADYGRLTDGMEGWAQIARSSSWWWPREGAVVLTDRPASLHLDAQGRLHSTGSMAIAYRDGWGIYAVHGVRVDERIVMHPETITVGEVWKEANAERRRVMIEAFGWDRFVVDAGLALVDECADPANAPHTLKLYDLPTQIYGEPVRVVLCVNASPERDGTRRTYALTVPVDCDSALGAVAWTAGVSAKAYKALERAT